MGYLAVTIRDHSKELSTFQVRVDDQAGADVWTVVTGLGTALAGLVNDLIIGEIASIVYRQDAVAPSPDTPANGFAQREQGLRLFYHDDANGKKYNMTIATPDLGTLAVEGTDEVPLAQSDVAALVTWLESNMLSPEGNDIVIDKAVLVGRNN